VSVTRTSAGAVAPRAPSNRPPPAISVHHLSYAYAAEAPRPALADVSFEIEPGELVAVIGANGSGKSTLLKLIGGLLEIHSGEVAVLGRAVHAPDPGVGFVFQEPRLLPWRSTLDNVGLPLELAGWRRTAREERARDLLQLVGIPDTERLRPHQLSGGTRQRAAIARALALEPSVLLLDEPFSALDALTRERFNLLLQSIWRATGTTILLVTHSISEAIFLADRVLALGGQPGRLAARLEIGLPRPRSFEDLDAALVSQTAAEIRTALELDEKRVWAEMVA